MTDVAAPGASAIAPITPAPPEIPIADMTPAQVRERLAARQADPEWGAARLRGDQKARAEADALFKRIA